MLPEVEKYFAAEKAAKETYETAMREASGGKDYWSLSHTERTAQAAVETAAYTALSVARRESREGLYTSSDPLVTWIAKNTLGDYPEHSQRILKLLPATYGELNSYANDHGWCNVFTRLANQAVADGVMTDTRTPREVFVAELAEHRLLSGVRRMVLEQADRYVAAAVKAALEGAEGQDKHKEASDGPAA